MDPWWRFSLVRLVHLDESRMSRTRRLTDSPAALTSPRTSAAVELNEGTPQMLSVHPGRAPSPSSSGGSRDASDRQTDARPRSRSAFR